jgi:hypothetical protein
VSLPEPMHTSEALIESLTTCLQFLGRETQYEHSLLEFAANYSVDDDAAGQTVLAQTCALVQRHRHTLGRLKVPILRQDGALSAFAGALAECTAITSLDISTRMFPFRSWWQLGPTLRTLVLGTIDRGRGMDVTFRLLADNMPALRELHFYISRQPSQDGFIELVSRLQSLSLIARGQPWDVVHDASAWPLMLPNLKELMWSTGAENADPVAVAVLRRAVSLRAADVSHASALAAIAAGSHAIAVDCNVDPCMHYAPLANLQ